MSNGQERAESAAISQRARPGWRHTRCSVKRALQTERVGVQGSWLPVRRISRSRDSADLNADAVWILDRQAHVVRRVQRAAPREAPFEASALELGPDPVGVPVVDLEGEVI